MEAPRDCEVGEGVFALLVLSIVLLLGVAVTSDGLLFPRM